MRVKRVCDCAEPCKHPYHYAFKHKGQLHRSSTHTSNKQLAERIAAKAREEVIGGGLAKPWVAPFLKDHIAEYIAHQRIAFPNNAAHAARVLAGLLDVVGNKRIDQVTRFDIQRWRSARLKEVVRNTVEQNEHAVRGCFTYAADTYEKQRFLSPCRKLKPLKVGETKRRAMSADEIARALRGLAGDLRLVFLVTLVTLARLSEVLNLERRDLGATWITFRRKGGRIDTVQAPVELIAELRAKLVTPEQIGIFGDRDPVKDAARIAAWHAKRAAKGKPPGIPDDWREVRRKYFSLAYYRTFKRLGLVEISHHIARHTGVTLMLEQGRHGRTIQELAGWTTLRMLGTYGHVRDEAQQQAVQGNAAVVAAALATMPGAARDQTADQTTKRGIS